MDEPWRALTRHVIMIAVAYSRRGRLGPLLLDGRWIEAFGAWFSCAAGGRWCGGPARRSLRPEAAFAHQLDTCGIITCLMASYECGFLRFQMGKSRAGHRRWIINPRLSSWKGAHRPRRVGYEMWIEVDAVAHRRAGAQDACGACASLGPAGRILAVEPVSLSPTPPPRPIEAPYHLLRDKVIIAGRGSAGGSINGLATAVVQPLETAEDVDRPLEE